MVRIWNGKVSVANVSNLCRLCCSLLIIVSQGCAIMTSEVPSDSNERLKLSNTGWYSKYRKISPKSDLSIKAVPTYSVDRPNEGKFYLNDGKPYQVFGQWYHPLTDARGFRERGIASWYGEAFHGKRTSSGEIYDMNAISAAHKLLPLGTLVRVKNLENGKELDLIINDRGPFIAGRVIDLSKAAARELGIYDPGTAQVEVIALGQLTASSDSSRCYSPIDFSKGNFCIQVGAFKDRIKAEKLAQELRQSYGTVQCKSSYSHTNGELFYRVVVGKYSDLQQAETYEGIMKKRGFGDAFTVAD